MLFITFELMKLLQLVRNLKQIDSHILPTLFKWYIPTLILLIRLTFGHKKFVLNLNFRFSLLGFKYHTMSSSYLLQLLILSKFYRPTRILFIFSLIFLSSSTTFIFLAVMYRVPKNAGTGYRIQLIQAIRTYVVRILKGKVSKNQDQI